MRRLSSTLFALFVCLLAFHALADTTPSRQTSPAAPAAPAPAPARPAPRPATQPPDKKTYFLEVVDLPAARLLQRQGGVTSTIALPPVNASDIATVLNNDAEFVFKAIGKDKIAIFYKATGRPSSAPASLNSIKNTIATLATPGYDYAEVIRVRNRQAAAVAKVVNSWNIPGVTASAISGSQILLVASITPPPPGSLATPDPAFLANLRQRIYDARWDISSFTPVQRIFHIDASATVKSLTGSGDSGSGNDKKSSDKSSDSSGDSSKSGTTVSASSTASPTSTASPSISVTLNNAQPEKPAASNASPEDSNAQDPASKKSPQSKADAASSDKSSDQTAKVPKMNAVNDMIVYSNPDGSDDGIMERNRLLAVLDLPRPEVLLNVWSLQASSRSANVINTQAEVARQLVEHHNEVLQRAIDQGWDYLSQRMRDGMNIQDGISKAKETPATQTENQKSWPRGPFFETQFYDYVTQKFYLPLDSYRHFGYDEKTDAHPARGDESRSQLDSFNVDALMKFRTGRKKFGWCPENQYCLGFTHAFDPLRPTFTNILLTLIAANEPTKEIPALIGAMSSMPRIPVSISDPANCKDCSNEDRLKKFQDCICNQQQDVELQMIENTSQEDCQLEDRREILKQIRAGIPESLHLHCLEEQMKTSFEGDASSHQTTRVGLLRAAVADFLFNYKWATQYPHDFIPYDLSQSAQELNAEFNPLILEFNRDVAAFTENLQKELQCKQDLSESHSWFGKGDESFLNDAMISVRGISGVESIVDTVTQSFFDATNPPSLTDLVKSVSDAESKIPGVLKTNLTANEAAVLLGALNSVEPAHAKIGREFKVDITPHALAGASSAELDVKLAAEESAAPTRFTADKSAEDNLSRVAKHDTTTKIRVDSLKLFEVSAFSAMLQRPRSKFPILPPFFEVPYFGSFIAYPIPGAKVYHRSSAIVSAIIVPTAADLAYGIDFTADRVCETNLSSLNPGAGNWQPPFRCHAAASPSDFSGLPLRNFNKAIVQCFATSRNTAFTGLLAITQEENRQNLTSDKRERDSRCFDLTFDSIPWSD